MAGKPEQPSVEQLDLFDPTPITPKPEDTIPDPATDPDGWYRWFHAVNAAYLAERTEAQARRGRMHTTDPDVTAGGKTDPPSHR